MEKSKLKSLQLCFNSNCKKTVVEQLKNGWRLRSNGFAQLCHLCGSAYEAGKFCETFHLNASGWRCCETCGKQIHCGCIVSFHMFVLLDAGGIQCLTCTRRSFVLTPNPAWPLPSPLMPSHLERIESLSGKNWSPIAGSGPVPWRQAPSLFSGQKKVEQAKASFEFDVPSCTDILHFSDKMSAFSFERQHNEDCIRQILGSEKTWGLEPDILENRFSAFKTETQSKAFAIGSICTGSTKEDTYRNINTASVSVPKNNSVKKSSNHNELELSTDNQVHGGKANGDAQGRSHVLARYSPHITNQEILRIPGENHVITPLFEKTLSPSDAGRIGRLVLPKKCAEAYLPSISHPEGLPLEVGDAKGNEWLFQFRFWPNNNSRMYVLEGVTPCIQSLQLQAGDIVTFSRLEPEGKLIVGGRKSSATMSTYQGNEAVATIGRMSANGMNSKKCSKQCETDSMSISKPEERVDIDVSNSTKRKSCMLASINKSLMIDHCSIVQLKLTSREAQGLIRPPPGNGPNVIIIEDCEIEEYEIAPIIGRPCIPSNDCMGEKIKWVQCDDCLKWRKGAADTLLPSKWTCSANLWDKEKSMCSAAQELTSEQLVDLLPAITSFKKARVCKPESDSSETLEALNSLVNLATREEGSSLQATRRHPRHRPGCSCIVCMQPPSGKGPKHKQLCDCIVCESLKRRFRTLMTKRLEKQQLEKDAEMTLQKLEHDTDVDLLVELHHLNNNSAGHKICASPDNPILDLNSQPGRVKESSPRSDFASMFHLIHEAPGTQLEQQNQSCPTDDIHHKGLIEAMFSSYIAFDGSIDMDHLSAPQL